VFSRSARGASVHDSTVALVERLRHRRLGYARLDNGVHTNERRGAAGMRVKAKDLCNLAYVCLLLLVAGPLAWLLDQPLLS